MARKVEIKNILDCQREYLGDVLKEGYPRSKEWAEDAFTKAQKELGVPDNLMPRWYFCTEIDELNYHSDEDRGVTLGRFVPIDGVIKLSALLLWYGTQKVVEHVVYHEMCHVKHMTDILATKNKTSMKNKFCRWVTEEQYAHGPAFKKYMKVCQYQDETVIDWINYLDECRVIDF